MRVVDDIFVFAVPPVAGVIDGEEAVELSFFLGGGVGWEGLRENEEASKSKKNVVGVQWFQCMIPYMISVPMPRCK